MNHYKQSEELYQRLELLTQEDINNVFSVSQVCELLNCPIYNSGKGYRGQKLVKKYIENNFNIRHFTGQAWNKENYNYELFCKNNIRKSCNLREPLFALRGKRCERCGLSKWNNIDISLEIHHIDGDRSNNELNNLLILCPNCHSQTDNWRGRNNNSGKKKVSDEELIKALKENDNIHQALKELNLESGNYKRAYELKAKYNL